MNRLLRVDAIAVMAVLMTFSTAASAFFAGVNGGGSLDIDGGNLFDDYTMNGSGTATATTLDFSWSLSTDGIGNLSSPVFMTGSDSLDFSGTPSGTRIIDFCDDGGTNDVCGSIPPLAAIAYDVVFVNDPILFAGDTGLYDTEVTITGSPMLFFSEGHFVTTAVVPIPAAFWLFGSAFGLLGFARRK